MNNSIAVIRKRFAVKVKQYRSDNFWLQQELAGKANLKARTIQDIEGGEKKHLTSDIVTSLAEAFRL